jgi:IMP dehydrogenase/GMP reductase
VKIRARSVPFSQTRIRHASETAEDYVEAVLDIIDEKGECRILDLSRFFNVSHVTVSRIVKRLKDEDLLYTQQYKPVELTEKGYKLAKKSKKCHEIVLAFLIKLGVDIIKIGIGPGSICTTRLVAGIGVPQLSAILSVRNGLKSKNVKIISDGGIKYSGDLAKAFAAGADAVMIGSLFAGTDETPGKLIKKNGKFFKSFRGMGSVGAMNKGSADRYFQTKQKDSSKYVPEGVEGFARYKGNVGSIIYKLIGGLKSSMGYLGSKNILKLKNKPNFVKITKAGFYESMVHNVDVVKNDSKY